MFLIYHNHQDGYFLATLLSIPSITRKDIPKVLHVYDSIRRPFASDVNRRSNLNGSYYTMNNPEFKYRLAEALPGTPEQEKVLHELAGAMKSNWEWAWTSSISDSVEMGVVTLKRLISGNAGMDSGVSAVL